MVVVLFSLVNCLWRLFASHSEVDHANFTQHSQEVSEMSTQLRIQLDSDVNSRVFARTFDTERSEEQFTAQDTLPLFVIINAPPTTGGSFDEQVNVGAAWKHVHHP